MEVGVRILRVPYCAAKCLHKQLEQAINECTQPPTLRFILWSTDPPNSYGALERRGDTYET